MTMTTLHLGQAPGRARRSAVSRHAWRPESLPAAAFHACDTTSGYLGDTTDFTGNLAGVMGFTTIKRPARHLARRST